MNLVHIVLAFGAGVVFTIIGLAVANILKPKEVDRIEDQARGVADQARSAVEKLRS